MSPRGRFLLATLCGLVLAGLVHIAVVLAIPTFSEADALSRARTGASLDHAMRVHTLATGSEPAPAEAWLPIPDPAVAVGICAYDLNEGPLRVSARTGPLMLSLAVHGRRGAFYAVTDQAAVRGGLDLVVLTRAQYDEVLANEDENEVSRDVRIVAPEREGYVVVRVIAGLPSQRAGANEAVQAVSCTVDTEEEETKPGG
ncbi:DUF1254 domain-containing protein [Methylobacterium iners]|jgi:uncharacterized membrane protein|uniref:DUF1254 domain-containing protein n=1 Tax=Methylobacterium iners TaxID=418707 RepID=A0ABQ4RV58_9HYPH|nr:hypothetical protein [Methylobacterium iners]GJD94099.1 hypothetical protein OCOJLMKI_1300 [Methylobacterium iners]